MQWDEIKITELSSCSTESEWLQSGGSSLPGTGAVPPERLGRRRLRRLRRPVAGGDAASLPAADPQHPRPPTTVDVDVAIESGDVDGDDDDQIARRKHLHPIGPVCNFSWWQHFGLSSSKTSWRRIRNGSVGFRSIRHRNVSSATGTIRYFCWWILFGTGWSAAFDPIRWTSGRMLADWNWNRRGRTRSTALDPRRLWCDDFARIRCSSLPPHPRRGRSTAPWNWFQTFPYCFSACRLPTSFALNEENEDEIDFFSGLRLCDQLDAVTIDPPTQSPSFHCIWFRSTKWNLLIERRPRPCWINTVEQFQHASHDGSIVSFQSKTNLIRRSHSSHIVGQVE